MIAAARSRQIRCGTAQMASACRALFSLQARFPAAHQATGGDFSTQPFPGGFHRVLQSMLYKRLIGFVLRFMTCFP